MKSSYFVGQSNSSFSYSQNSYSYAYSQAQNKHDHWTTSDSEKLHEIVEATEESVSWAAVASEVFSSTGNSHSPISCYIQYTNVTDIIINKENWTDEEDNLLIYLAKKYREHNWSEIACELGTNRTPFECIKRHQQNFNARLLNEGDWSTDEDSELRNAVLMYGVCWDRVASVVRGRTADQCNRRWSRNSLAEGASAGKFWSEEEQATLLMAAKAFGVPSIAQSYELCAQRRDMLLSIREPKKTDIDMIEAVLPFDNKNYDLESSFVTEWGKIAALLPGRSSIQCRDKYFCSLDPGLRADSYDEQEIWIIEHLVNLVEKHLWRTLSSFLPGRNEKNVRLWYVRQHFSENPNLPNC